MLNFARKNIKYILLVSFFCILILIIIFYSSNKISAKNNNKLSEIKKEENQDNFKEKQQILETYFVDIKGAVKTPGVYQMDVNSRVIDVINIAGGLLDNASTDNLNLSKKVKDEMYIIIYTKKQLNDYYKQENNKNSTISCMNTQCVCPDKLNDACLNIDNSNEKPENKSKISINTSSKDELMTLSGIGEAKAINIINYRNEHGNFKSIEEIINVSGISENIFEKIKENITL